MNCPKELKYTRSHEWVRVEKDEAVVGITEHAQDALGDIVYLELPEVGETFEREQVFGVVESVKTTSDLYAPIKGTIVAVNEAAVEDSSLVNSDPYGKGWMIRMKIEDESQLADLLDAETYQAEAAKDEH